MVIGSPQRPLGIVVGREPACAPCSERWPLTLATAVGSEFGGVRGSFLRFSLASGSPGRRAASWKGWVSPGKVSGRRFAEARTVGHSDEGVASSERLVPSLLLEKGGPKPGESP